VRRDFSQRSAEHEIMDGGIANFKLFDQSLRQIEAVNRLTLGYRPVLRWLEAQLSPPGPVTICDIGCGRGDLLRRIWLLGQRKHIPLRLVGIDIDPWSAPAARDATPADMSIEYRTGDALRIDVAADFIVCSTMTHHLSNHEIVSLIRRLEIHARRGWLISDLHRHFIPYAFARLVLGLAPVNGMVRNDGAVSVARAFTAQDWRDILREAGVGAELSWCFPFRYCVTRNKLKYHSADVHQHRSADVTADVRPTPQRYEARAMKRRGVARDSSLSAGSEKSTVA
jgi:2-polyprenyl-3-methyl-5-hydroxy-6-metoxy-1,4-benzoquinol methylase